VALKRGLGKGLSALLPEETIPSELSLSEQVPPEQFLLESLKAESQDDSSESAAAETADVSGYDKTKKGSGEIFIALEKLKANPNQPRKSFDEAELSELADSIRQQGIIQPIIAEDAEDGTYTIIAGERRARAAKLAGLEEAPVILRKYSDEKRMIVSLIENIQRANLNPIEEASAYRKLMELEDLSQDETAARVGKNRATVANALRLLKLPDEMQESIKNNELSPGHARAILSVSGAKAQETLFREIIKKGLSVREAEKRASGSPDKKTKKSAVKSRAPELAAMEEKFITRLGTKVVVNGNLSKGTIEIDYYSMEDLERLYEILGG
jgi:ParB family chromosome partitioning protein